MSAAESEEASRSSDFEPRLKRRMTVRSSIPHRQLNVVPKALPVFMANRPVIPARFLAGIHTVWHALSGVDSGHKHDRMTRGITRNTSASCSALWASPLSGLAGEVRDTRVDERLSACGEEADARADGDAEQRR